jgi:hypothetical protein
MRRLVRLAAGGFVSALLGMSSVPATGAEPELPRVYLNTTSGAPTGLTIRVAAGGDFQAALNAAQPGDTITLEAGAAFRGPFTLPKKSGAGWIIIRSSAPDSSLPPAGTRITPSYAAVMPTVVTPNSGPALRTAPGAHHFRFIGIEFAPVRGVFSYALIALGAGERSEDQLPHDIIFDRCYIRGDPAKGGRRGIALNSKSTAVIDSYLSDFKEVGADSQAIAGWNGPGPFKIVNNYLEGAGENVMFGGADPSIPDLVPSDIEIRGNHFAKPLSWRAGHPSYAGTPWTVKNLFELKNARRVLVEGNLFEYSWLHAQTGFAILFTVRNQDGRAPWSTVEDVTFRANLVRHAGGGIAMHGRDNNYPSRQTTRVLIQHNVFEDISRARWGGDGRLFQIIRGIADLVIDHNTAFQDGPIIMAEGPPQTAFVYRNNLTPRGDAGVIGTGTGEGLRTLATYFPGAVFVRNVLVDGNPSLYPVDNFFPAGLDQVGFVDSAAGNYRLAASSPYKNAGTDGKDIGADIAALRRSRPFALPRP